MTTARNYVIVGCGPAGVVAAETLRKTDPAGKIVMVGDEPDPPYSRMALPYVLCGNIGEDGTYLRKDKGHYDALGIERVTGRAVNLDPKKKKLALKDGKTIGYDRLLIATGATPINPPIPGIDLPNVHNCWTLEDGRQIAALAKPKSRVVLMGAGFIGCIILEALASRGVELTVVEMGDRMVPRMLNDTAGNLLKKWCSNKGINVKTSTKISAVEKGAADALSLTLEGVGKSGTETLDCDLLISCAGVSSNISFLEGSGVEVKQGVLIDNHMQSSVEDVFAAGDAAEGRDFSTGDYSVHAIQPTATEHGRIAALNMAGVSTPYKGSLNMNVLDTLGLISSSFGLWEGVKNGERAESLNEEAWRYLCLQFEGETLVGAQSLGLTEHVGVLRGLIQSRTALGEWKDRLIKDPTLIMEAYLSALKPV